MVICLTILFSVSYSSGRASSSDLIMTQPALKQSLDLHADIQFVHLHKTSGPSINELLLSHILEKVKIGYHQKVAHLRDKVDDLTLDHFASLYWSYTSGKNAPAGCIH